MSSCTICDLLQSSFWMPLLIVESFSMALFPLKCSISVDSLGTTDFVWDITPSHGLLKMPLFMIWSMYVCFTCTYALVLPQSFWVLYLAKNTYTSQANWKPLISFLFITDYNQLKFSLTAPVGVSHQSRALALGLTCSGSMSCYEFRT